MANKPIQLTRSDVRHLTILAVATVIIASALFASWWTRGYTVEYGDEYEDSGNFENLVDTLTVSYGPFSTPEFGPFQFDSVRETAVTVTGIAVALCAVFMIASNLVAWGIRNGRVDTDHGVPVKLAIAAFWLGLFGVLFALFWPFMGLNSNAIYSGDAVDTGVPADVLLVESAEYLNIGFYLGFIGFVAYPAYLWYHAHLVRLDSAATIGTKAGATA